MKLRKLLIFFGLLSLLTHVFATDDEKLELNDDKVLELNATDDEELVLTAIAFAVGGGTSIYVPIMNDFKNYAKENGLNTSIHLILYSLDNATSVITDYEAMLDFIFSRGSDKYDLIFYDNIFATKYAKHLLDLRDIVPKETLDEYMEGVASKTCVIKDRIVGLPVSVDYTVLYYNEQLLQQYNKSVPKTWDQLIETGEYIKNKSNNTDLVIYNGLFGSSENGLCSLYEFLYSYRNEVESPFPKITSNEAVEGLEKIKELKNRISSDEEFIREDDYIFNNIVSRNFVFIKYWHIQGMGAKITLMPGRKEGISGSTIGGYNIGISKYSNIKYREKVIEAFNYIVSKDIQRKYIAEKNLLSPIPSLYDEEEVCQKVDCKFFKSIQLTGRPIDKLDNYDDYTSRFRKYAFEYIYGDDNVKAIDVLKKIDDITKIYSLTLNTEDTSAGLILFILVTITITTMILTLIFPYIKKFQPYFSFLPNDFWIIYILGLILILFSFFFEYGENSPFKCYAKIPFIMIGLTLNYIPILYKLIVCIPINSNKVSVWVKSFRYYFLGIFILIDLFLLLILGFFPYVIKTEYIVEGKNFQVCEQNHPIGNVIYYLLISVKLFIFIISFLFIFMEWNIRVLHLEIRLITTTLYLSIIIVLLFIIVKNVVLDKTKNYIANSIVRLIIYLFYVITNYIFLYGYRIFGPILFKDDDDIYKNLSTFRSAMNNEFSVTAKSDLNNTTHQQSTSLYYEKSSMIQKASNKIMQCHYQTNLESEMESNYSISKSASNMYSNNNIHSSNNIA